MIRRGMRTRVAKLDRRGPTTGTIEMNPCGTQKEYEEAFALAWNQVPDGSLVYCWLREVSACEFCDLLEGRLTQPCDVLGIYIKPLRLTPDFQERETPCR